MLRGAGRKVLEMAAASLSARRTLFSSRRGGYVAGPSGESVLYGLIGANAAVFAAWQVLDPSFMTRHFTVSLPNLEAGRVHTLITHAFSHISLLHMGTNLVALYFFGGAMTRVLLGKQLLNLYLMGGACSAIADIAWKLTTMGGRSKSWSEKADLRDHCRRQRFRDAPSLGASGAVNSIVSLFCVVFPKELIYLYFVIPIPAFLLGALFVLHDFSSLRTEDNVSHAGHLGGVALGLFYFLRLRYRL